MPLRSWRINLLNATCASSFWKRHQPSPPHPWPTTTLSISRYVRQLLSSTVCIEFCIFVIATDHYTTRRRESSWWILLSGQQANTLACLDLLPVLAIQHLHTDVRCEVKVVRSGVRRAMSISSGRTLVSFGAWVDRSLRDRSDSVAQQSASWSTLSVLFNNKPVCPVLSTQGCCVVHTGLYSYIWCVNP